MASQIDLKVNIVTRCSRTVMTGCILSDECTYRPDFHEFECPVGWYQADMIHTRPFALAFQVFILDWQYRFPGFWRKPSYSGAHQHTWWILSLSIDQNPCSGNGSCYNPHLQGGISLCILNQGLLEVGIIWAIAWRGNNNIWLRGFENKIDLELGWAMWAWSAGLEKSLH